MEIKIIILRWFSYTRWKESWRKFERETTQINYHLTAYKASTRIWEINMPAKFRNSKDRKTKPAFISLFTSTASLKTRTYLLDEGKQTTNHTKIRYKKYLNKVSLDSEFQRHLTRHRKATPNMLTAKTILIDSLRGKSSVTTISFIFKDF